MLLRAMTFRSLTNVKPVSMLPAKAIAMFP